MPTVQCQQLQYRQNKATTTNLSAASFACSRSPVDDHSTSSCETVITHDNTQPVTKWVDQWRGFTQLINMNQIPSQQKLCSML